MSLNVFVSFYIVGFFFPWFQEYYFSEIFGCFSTEKPPWRWSKMLFGGFLSHGGTPSHHPFLDRIFHETNHPAIGYLHRKPPCHRENDNKPLGFGGSLSSDKPHIIKNEFGNKVSLQTGPQCTWIC